MKSFFMTIIKYVKNIFLTLIVICTLTLIIARNFKLMLSSTFLYAGLICLITGCLSLTGNIKMTSSYKYFQAQSISRSVNESMADNYKSRNSSLRFLTFMSITGAILLLISGILVRLNL